MSIVNNFLPPLKSINFKNEILAGLTVAMTMIPESLSFAILAGLSPLTGLYAAFIMGIFTAILGGRPGLVSGGAGATIVVMINLIAQHGVQYLFAALILSGLIQILVGLFKWGKFVQLIPKPVMYGFLNGLAVIIFMAQLAQFKLGVNLSWMQGKELYLMIGLTLITVAIVYLWPKLNKAIPASLIAIILLSLLVYFLPIETIQVVDIATVSGAMPSFNIPAVPINVETLLIILPYSLMVAAVGLVETLLTFSMVDEITQTKGNPNKESWAQGTANMMNGFLGGMGGCAMVAQTMVNVNAGGRTRLAAIIGALTILAVILVAGPIIEQIPVAALVGVMMVVSIQTFQWSSFRIIYKMPRTDIFIGISVAAITILTRNLAIAVFIGVLLAALVFAWDSAQRIVVKEKILENGNKVYQVSGTLFFGATTIFQSKFTPETDPQSVIIDFTRSRIADMSALATLEAVIKMYQEKGKTVRLQTLNQESVLLIKNSKNQMLIDSLN